jgi:hypothetical protein
MYSNANLGKINLLRQLQPDQLFTLVPDGPEKPANSPGQQMIRHKKYLCDGAQI